MSFDTLYGQRVEFSWRVVRRLGLSESSVEDAVQEVFVVAYRRRADFEGRSTLRTWLYGIAIRVARKFRAREQRRASTLDETIATGSDVGPEKQLERSEALEVVQEALEAMEENKREVFVLAEIEDLSAPEIADAVGIPLNTVYSRLRAARQEFEASVKRSRARDRWRTV
jgi:RNA polymerase sigma-70 factor (ECF subfamily)